MTSGKKGVIYGGVLCLTVSLTACSASKEAAAPAGAPVAPLSGTIDAGMVTATATVKAVDQKTRRVTLRRADGSLIKFTAGDNVRNLAQVKVGDEVTVNYYESLAYEVLKPGEAAPGAAIAEDVQRAKLGAKPGAAGARVTTVTVTITAINKAAGTVTLQDPDGDASTIKVRYPEKLDRVAVGDLVQLTYTEAVAVSVETPTKK
jgi:Cu/Ag efflux protein CusF